MEEEENRGGSYLSFRNQRMEKKWRNGNREMEKKMDKGRMEGEENRGESHLSFKHRSSRFLVLSGSPTCLIIALHRTIQIIIALHSKIQIKSLNEIPPLSWCVVTKEIQ